MDSEFNEATTIKPNRLPEASPVRKVIRLRSGGV